MTTDDMFSDPELHAQITEEVKESDERGPAGKLTKDKKQLVEEEYKEQGGKYKDQAKKNDKDNAKANDDSQSKDENEDEGDIEMEDAEDSKDEEVDDDKEESEDTGEKRKRSTKSQSASKKQKANSGEAKTKSDDDAKSNGTHGSKHDSADEPAPKGSNDRLPKKGQRVSWKAMPGWVHGKVLEIVTSDKDMKGKHIKASKEEPRIALEAESGKFCVHKPDNCYFED